jgi:hypothetical protein
MVGNISFYKCSNFGAVMKRFSIFFFIKRKTPFSALKRVSIFLHRRLWEKSVRDKENIRDITSEQVEITIRTVCDNRKDEWSIDVLGFLGVIAK